ncbi:DUF4178 domain-containing protein [Tumebacillus permanentifrigoris]|uniref:Uncharacterized protein DUF4178 n=1 Tax=Tumebacillus permanentifrigoris TaxID=378543 RepID=A0A316DDN7_9BACL|nr:DUF4178 domain-containing protein [Tumebacillus permanentifrigoris]PWK13767.1 uncharacterized protein DUF4178 [Tumebacillus permanentifrigoris]
MSVFDRIKNIWRANNNEAPQVVQRTLTNLKIGDIISYDLEDYKVEGVTTYRSGGQVKYGYLLSGPRNGYLMVEPRESIRVYLYETLDARLENPEAINQEMVYDDVSYFEQARGEFSVNVQGRSAFNSYDILYWWLHVSDDGGAMLFEWQSGEIIIRVGNKVKPSEVRILPGSE